MACRCPLPRATFSPPCGSCHPSKSLPSSLRLPCATPLCPDALTCSGPGSVHRRSSVGVARAAVSSDSESKFTSPKAGAVGEERFRQSASPGTYWSSDIASSDAAGTPIAVEFDTGSETVRVEGVVGENMLRLAERAGAMIPNEEFCFEGTCCHCEMEVEGGAKEVGYRAFGSSDGLIRSCICPVPSREPAVLSVQILGEDGAWGAGVL